jgi:putative tricarboxylic transport membrane protein
MRRPLFYASNLKSCDGIISILFILLAVFICQQSLLIRIGSLSDPGPGLFPFGAGLGIGFLSIIYLLRSIAFMAIDDENLQVAAPKNETRKLWTVGILLFGYIILVNWLGFVVSTFLFSLLFLRVAAAIRWWQLLLMASLVTLGNYLLFIKWIGVNLPKAIW